MHASRRPNLTGFKIIAVAAICAVIAALGATTHVSAAASAASATLSVTNPSLVFIQGSTRIALDSDQASASWSVTDDQQQPVRSGNAAIADGSGQINLDKLGPGYYNLSVTAGGTTRTTSFVVLSPLPAGPRDQRFGVGMHLDGGMNSHWINDAGNVGFGAVRTDVSWGAVEQAKGVYTYPTGEDTAISQLHDLGIKPLLITDYRNPFYDDNKTPSSPAAQQAFANFSSNILDHYGYATNQLEVYNEFNGGFNDGACGNTPDCYLPLLAAVYKQVKTDHPDATVVGPALAGIDTAWLDRLFQLGGLNDLDAVTVHTYTYPSPPEGKIDGQVAAGRSTIDAAGGKDKELWLDENGWSTFQGSTTEPDQADYVIRSESLSLGNGVSRFFYYDWINDGTDPTYNEDNFGLLRQPASGVTAPSPKPALITQAVMIRQVHGLAYTGRDDIGANGYSYKFGSGSDTKRVLWTTNGTSKTVALAASGPVTVTDEYGRSSTYQPAGGKVDLGIDQHPVFVSGAVTAVAADNAPAYSIDTPTTIASGDPIPVTIAGTPTSTRPVTVRFLIGDKTFPLTLCTGCANSTKVMIDPITKTGVHDIVATVRRGHDNLARFSASTKVVDPVTVSVTPAVTSVDPPQGQLAIGVTNNHEAAAADISTIDWSVGDRSGSTTADTSVAAGTTATVKLAPTDVEFWNADKYAVTVHLADGSTATANGTTGFNPIEPDGKAAAPAIDLATQGNPVALNRDWSGPDDLSGSVRVNYTAQNLIVTADITDNVFWQTNTASNLWQGDSIQFGVSTGLPGTDTRGSTEIGAALLDTGPAAYTFGTLDGTATGPTAGAAVQVTRSGTITRYRVAVPWTSLGFAQAPTGVFSLSMLVNDNDNDSFGRADFVEWGSGIGIAKDNAQFRPAILTAD